MRIAYVAAVPVDQESGVLGKIRSQVEQWSRCGHSVRLYALSATSRVWPGLNALDVEAVAQGNLWQRPVQTALLARRVLAWHPDIVYVRFQLYYPAWETFLRRVPAIVEINTDDRQEFCSWSWWRYRYHLVTRRRLLGLAKGIVYVSAELKSRLHMFGQPALVLGNGFDMESVEPSPAPSNVRPRLVFIGSPGYPWHGIDKLFQLARLEPGWDFDVIGYGPADVTEDRPPNVTLHGYLGRSRYETLLRSADVAVGTLALHRIGFNEASPLKVREYLAYGIPVLIGYEDTDLPQEAPWLLRIPNQEDSVHKSLELIEDFVRRCRGLRVPRRDVMHLDTRTKEALRLEFMKTVVESQE